MHMACLRWLPIWTNSSPSSSKGVGVPKSIRTYQRKIAQLTQLVRDMQWVQPIYNGADSCAGCGAMRHHGCYSHCPAAKVTGDKGTGHLPDSETVPYSEVNFY